MYIYFIFMSLKCTSHFLRWRNMWKLLGVRSRLYGRWSKSSHYNWWIFSTVRAVVCGHVLFWMGTVSDFGCVRHISGTHLAHSLWQPSFVVTGLYTVSIKRVGILMQNTNCKQSVFAGFCFHLFNTHLLANNHSTLLLKKIIVPAKNESAKKFMCD